MVMFGPKGELGVCLQQQQRHHRRGRRSEAGRARDHRGLRAARKGGALNADGSRYYVTCSNSGTIQVIDTAARKAVGEIKTGSGRQTASPSHPIRRPLVYSIGGDDTKIGLRRHRFARADRRPSSWAASPLSCSLSKDGKPRLRRRAGQRRDLRRLGRAARSRPGHQDTGRARSGPGDGDRDLRAAVAVSPSYRHCGRKSLILWTFNGPRPSPTGV